MLLCQNTIFSGFFSTSPLMLGIVESLEVWSLHGIQKVLWHSECGIPGSGPRDPDRRRWLSKIQQQQRVLAPWQMTQEFLPTGRWRRSTPIPCFLAERKCSEKRSPKHSDQKKSEKPWLFELLSWSHQEVGAVWRPKMGNTVEKSDLC